MKKIYFYKIVIEAINETDNITVDMLHKRLNITERQISDIVRDFNSDFPEYKIKVLNGKFKVTNKIPKNFINTKLPVTDINIHLILTTKYLLKNMYKYSGIPNSIQYGYVNYRIESINKTLEFFGFEDIRKIFKYSVEDKKYIICILYQYFNIFEKHNIDDSFYSADIWGKSTDKMSEIIKCAYNYTDNLIEKLGDKYNNSTYYFILFNYFVLESVLNFENIYNTDTFNILDFTIKLPTKFDRFLLETILILEVEYIENDDNELLESDIERLYSIISNNLNFRPVRGLIVSNTTCPLFFNFYSYWKISQKDEDYTFYKLYSILMSKIKYDVNKITIDNITVRHVNEILDRDSYHKIFKEAVYSQEIFIKKSTKFSIYSDLKKDIYINYRREDDLITTNNFLIRAHVLNNKLNTSQMNIINYLPSSLLYRYTICDSSIINIIPNNLIEIYLNDLTNIYSTNPHDKYKTLPPIIQSF